MSNATKETLGPTCIQHDWVSRVAAAPYCSKCRLILGSERGHFLDPYEEAKEIAARANPLSEGDKLVIENTLGDALPFLASGDIIRAARQIIEALAASPSRFPLEGGDA